MIVLLRLLSFQVPLRVAGLRGEQHLPAAGDLPGDACGQCRQHLVQPASAQVALETWGAGPACRPRLWLSPCLPQAGRDTRATSDKCLPTAVRDYPQLPASALHKRTRANISCLPQWCFSAADVRALTGHLLAAGGLCCRSPRRRRPEVLFWKNTYQESCCYFPDNCPHCAAGQLQWPAKCHLACAETVTHGKGPSEEGRGGWEEGEGPAATICLCVLSSYAGIELHIVIHGDSSGDLRGSHLSVVRPLLHAHSHFPGLPQSHEGQWGALWAALYSLKQA